MNTEIKTLDQILDEYAIEYGYEDYDRYCDGLTLSDSEWKEIAERYAQQFKNQLENNKKLLSDALKELGPYHKKKPNF